MQDRGISFRPEGGALTQSVEYLPFKQRVARSNRARPTMNFKRLCFCSITSFFCACRARQRNDGFFTPQGGASVVESECLRDEKNPLPGEGKRASFVRCSGTGCAGENPPHVFASRLSLLIGKEWLMTFSTVCVDVEATLLYVVHL